MSEYTDYMIYQSAAETLPQLHAEVAQQIGPSVIVFINGDMIMTEDAAIAALAATGKKWVAILTETSLAAMPAQNAVSIFVLEDFASWQLNVKCNGKVERFVFGGDDGYATDWFNANYGDGTLTQTVPDETLARLATCLGLPPAELRKNMAYEMPWAFLRSLNAPSVQMMDSGISLWSVEDKLKSGQVLFNWEAFEDDW